MPDSVSLVVEVSASRPSVVHLDGVPVRVFLESQDHQHDLVREFQLLQIGEQELGLPEPPHELARLVADILSRYSDVRSTTREQAVDALRRGDETTTLVVPVRPGMAVALKEWLRLLDTADRICASGQLLLVASSAEVRDLRRWYVEQITAQLGEH
jgi:hypothetical protein